MEAALKLLREINDIFVRASPTGPYFLGETFSLADLAVVPFLARFSILLPFYRGVDLLKLVSTHPVAARWCDVGTAHPCSGPGCRFDCVCECEPCVPLCAHVQGGESVSRLAATLAASSERPAFKRSFPPAEFLLASYYEYAGGTF